MNSTCFVATVGKPVHLQWILVHYNFSRRHGLIIHSFVSDLSLKTYSKLANKIIVSEIFSLFLIFFQILLPWKVSWLFGLSSDFYFAIFNNVFLYRCKTDVSLKHIRILELDDGEPLSLWDVTLFTCWVVLIHRALDLCLSTCHWWLTTLWMNSVIRKEAEGLKNWSCSKPVSYVLFG